jgi:hypothetical protein
MDDVYEDKTFIKMSTYIYGDEIENDKLQCMYNIYNILKYNINDDIVIIYNKIIKELYSGKDILYVNNEKILQDIYMYLTVIKNLDVVSEFKILFNFYISKNISTELYNKIYNYKIKLKTIPEKDLYLELWEIFLNPNNKEIIKRKIEYYILSFDNLKIINKNIVEDYINYLLSSVKLRKIYNYTENISNEMIFFGLMNNIFIK